MSSPTDPGHPEQDMDPPHPVEPPKRKARCHICRKTRPRAWYQCPACSQTYHESCARTHSDACAACGVAWPVLRPREEQPVLQAGNAACQICKQPNPHPCRRCATCHKACHSACAQALGAACPACGTAWPVPAAPDSVSASGHYAYRETPDGRYECTFKVQVEGEGNRPAHLFPCGKSYQHLTMLRAHYRQAHGRSLDCCQCPLRELLLRHRDPARPPESRPCCGPLTPAPVSHLLGAPGARAAVVDAYE
ncbi:hypothetical protein BO86DRAFT_374812 [Aspergillus japonicus CBS 114.51]|uniref:Phorbol-ester/DAG-type domain-containing protein n=1 Tax=Aspergillus japonicus CBS 114.51 TaxID=1448312 RepID=A0A8T8XEW0_ASPJA|nr:hypothetical protein BO86DRAFT_374812 [Aspergillus japonicus CBS 114.51]RAH86833.1 hypothetical protein BO86DRAFT_374812 [Aspergillus japonicus CBS 114.51]